MARDIRHIIAAVLLVVGVCQIGFSEQNVLKKSATWNWPSSAILQNQIESFAEQKNLPEESQARIASGWSAVLEKRSYGPQVFDALLDFSAEAEPRLSGLMNLIDSANETEDAENPNLDFSWFDSTTPEWLQQNIRLAVGRYLTQNRLYDEALLHLELLEPEQVADPSSLLFYRAVCTHNLLKSDECIADSQKLLERNNEIPVRFSVTAQIMISDIEDLEEDSLDEVTRLMNDVERRLDLGRATEKVIEEEQKIVEKLDKLIEKIEEQLQQQQQQQQQMQQQQQQQQQNQPMNETQTGGNSGPGDVDSKDIGSSSGWGDLPPKERQEALQNITKDLPSHYRDVIEAYFRRLGSGDGN